MVGLGKGERLRKDSEFANVRAHGRAWACDSVVLKAVPNGQRGNRYGFAVSKRVGNAVTRNRVKRRLREIVRLAPIEPGWDFVFIARPRAAVVGYQELNSAVTQLLRRAGVLAGAQKVEREGEASK